MPKVDSRYWCLCVDCCLKWDGIDCARISASHGLLSLRTIRRHITTCEKKYGVEFGTHHARQYCDPAAEHLSAYPVCAPLVKCHTHLPD